MSVKLRPIQNRVIAEFAEEKENKTAGGIYLPDTADKEKPQTAIVVAVGSGEDVQKEISEGDEIIFGRYAATEVTFEDKKYLILKLDDIAAVVHK